jgi:hypothetical protein
MSRRGRLGFVAACLGVFVLLALWVSWSTRAARWATDTRSEIDGAGLVDPRVTHLWDTGESWESRS